MAQCAATLLTDAQRQLLGKFTPRDEGPGPGRGVVRRLLGQCPVFDRFAEAAPVIKVRYLDRDEHADVQECLNSEPAASPSPLPKTGSR